MKNNGWIKLAVFSAVGIVVSVIALGFVSTNAGGTSSYQQQGMQMQNSVITSSPMGNMQVQGNMSITTNDQMMMQQQLSQMQQQLSQMQQQMGMVQGNMGGNMPAQNNMSTMPQGGSSSGSMSMPMM